MRDRWIHEGQRPEFVAHESAYAVKRLKRDPVSGAVELAGPRSRRLDRLAWEGAIELPAAPLTPGFEWADTIAMPTDPADGAVERLGGVWRYRVVRDTTIGGLRLLVVRTDADVRYYSREEVRERASDTWFVVEREVTGTIGGFVAVDASLGVRASGADTTRWSGRTTLTMAGSGPQVSGIRYERTRSWEARDSVTWRTYQDSLRQAAPPGSFSMVRMPSTPLEARLKAGETAVIDSLVAAWRETGDPDAKRNIERLFQSWRPYFDVQELLLRLHAQAGDTAYVIADLAGASERARPGRRLTAAQLDSVLPYLRDPARLWRLGIVPTGVYSGLAERALRSNPILQRDEDRVACDPEACARLAELLDAPQDWRFNDAALVAAFALEPSRMLGRLRERAAEGSRIAAEALRIATGAGGGGPRAPAGEVPGAGADWRAWLAWLGGSVSVYPDHVAVLRFLPALTGRDPLADLVARFPTQTDSAFLVFGAILREANALPEPTPDELAELFLSESPAERQHAEDRLYAVFRERARPATDSVAAELLLPLIRGLFDGTGPPWQPLPEPGVDTVGPGDVPPPDSSHGWVFGNVNVRPVYMIGGTLPAIVEAQLPPSVRLVTQVEWDLSPQREAATLLTISEVRVVGDFAVVEWSSTVRRQRGPDEGPGGYASGTMLYLLKRPAGWLIVGGSGWQT